MKRMLLLLGIIQTIIGSMGCKEEPLRLLQTASLSTYPSGSAVSKYKNKFFLIGDDAASLYMLDSSLKPIDSLQLYESAQKRIDKELKADLEAMTVVRHKNGNYLLILGSGSTAKRNSGWKISLPDLDTVKIDLTVFYRRLMANGIQELNIEGIAATEGGLILANRGNLTNPKNQIIFTSFNFWEDPINAPISVSTAGFSDSAAFKGISGLEYSYKTGHLYLSVSTEQTNSSHEDGAIGNSYVWMIPDIVSKQNYAAINPQLILDLAAQFPAFKKQKIESLCILRENEKNISLLLTADNDDGQTKLFSVEWKQ